MDFTLDTYRLLLESLVDAGFIFQRFDDFLKNPYPKIVVLRHDVDLKPLNSLKTAMLENSMDISGTYFFRSVPQSLDEKTVVKIAGLGHEIGYHYENLALCNGDYECAIHDFEKNLLHLRKMAPVVTICMHGSPLSRWDSRLLWQRYSYRDYGIIGEPYFDVDFTRMLYLTDTGRRWDGEKVSVRDKVNTSDTGKPSSSFEKVRTLQFHSTFDIIRAAKKGLLPDKIMITVHPQRWDNRMLPWVKEYIFQNLKNAIKKAVVKIRG
ncbi:MAG: hypothetical protein JXB00_16900 [Bacteroidales bacterium]|nr:hypothetical protein [Bacteroidales bacterium]